eukprot:1159805-Pelagomonas_calceolata.AAC.3
MEQFLILLYHHSREMPSMKESKASVPGPHNPDFILPPSQFQGSTLNYHLLQGSDVCVCVCVCVCVPHARWRRKPACMFVHKGIYSLQEAHKYGCQEGNGRKVNRMKEAFSLLCHAMFFAKLCHPIRARFSYAGAQAVMLQKTYPQYQPEKRLGADIYFILNRFKLMQNTFRTQQLCTVP